MLVLSDRWKQLEVNWNGSWRSELERLFQTETMGLGPLPFHVFVQLLERWWE
jgi:hypothetical protein